MLNRKEKLNWRLKAKKQIRDEANETRIKENAAILSVSISLFARGKP